MGQSQKEDPKYPRRSPQILLLHMISSYLIYPKAAQIHDDSPVSTIFRHSFR